MFPPGTLSSDILKTPKLLSALLTAITVVLVLLLSQLVLIRVAPTRLWRALNLRTRPTLRQQEPLVSPPLTLPPPVLLARLSIVDI